MSENLAALLSGAIEKRRLSPASRPEEVCCLGIDALAAIARATLSIDAVRRKI
jgi:hypothetical protein